MAQLGQPSAGVENLTGGRRSTFAEALDHTRHGRHVLKVEVAKAAEHGVADVSGAIQHGAVAHLTGQTIGVINASLHSLAAL